MTPFGAVIFESTPFFWFERETPRNPTISGGAKNKDTPICGSVRSLLQVKSRDLSKGTGLSFNWGASCFFPVSPTIRFLRPLGAFGAWPRVSIPPKERTFLSGSEQWAAP